MRSITSLPGARIGLPNRFSSPVKKISNGSWRLFSIDGGSYADEVVLRTEIAGQSSMIPLGFNYSQMHDSSACIARDGELLFAVAEERISRIKHDAGFPRLVIRACLDFAKVHPDQLDFICQGWLAPRAVFAADLKCFLRGQYPVTYLNVLNSARLYASMAHQDGGFKLFRYHFGSTKAQMRFVDHHLAHAISAYSYSGFHDAAVVVMDGRGAWEASSIWYGHGGRLDHVLTIPWPDSLGLFYAQFTQ